LYLGEVGFARADQVISPEKLERKGGSGLSRI
jgi:hypothetical protein